MLVLEDPGRFQAQAEGQNLGAVHAMPCLLSSWRSYPGPAQGANSTPNDEEPEFAQGINARKYQSLAEVSKATATRDLAELVEKGCLSKLPGGGRSTRYSVEVG